MPRRPSSPSLPAVSLAAVDATRRSGFDGLLDKHELAAQLNLSSTRIIDAWVKRRVISFYRLGHRTLKFSLPQVLEDLDRFEIKAVSRVKK